MKKIADFFKKTKIKVFASILCIAALLCSAPSDSLASQKSTDIVILYENDVHCSIDGYTKLSAIKNELLQTHEYVGVVSSGDYIQGNSIGSLSRGEYIIRLMNLVGYDAVMLGNHEFDFKLGRLKELAELMKTKPVCCNFQKISEPEPFFEPYTIVSYGDVDIAYIGIVTPATLSSTSTLQFKDGKGEYAYTFHSEDLCETVQKHVNDAIAEGADRVIALTHLGDIEPMYNAHEIIAGVEGIDVVLDAHSHSVIESRVIKDKGGNDVIVSSTGTKFEYIGKLTISESGIKTELIETAGYEKTDPAVDACLAEINNEYTTLGSRKVCVSEVDLITHDENGNRLVRANETNLGNFCADALRIVTGADVSYMNGGGIRESIKAGDVTYNDLLDVLPFNNTPVVLEVSGQVIWDVLESTTRNYPEEEGSFPHVSGMTFSVDTSIPSSVVLDKDEMFIRVDGKYRVSDIKVLNSETSEYEPLDPDKMYTIAGLNHSLLEGGGGLTMFEGAKIVMNNGDLDVDLIERYINENLGGVIGQQYAQVKHNITFTEGSDSESFPIVWVVVVGAAVIIIVSLSVFFLVAKRRGKKEEQA